MIQMTGTAVPDGSRFPKDQLNNFESVALFAALRSLHAKQASIMPEREWEKPNGKGRIYIIEDTEMRDYYGQIIGRIAQSHHWDIDRVAREFSTRKAPPPGLPAEWELNELKIASLLRCADASHIDQRRASLMEFILANPKGISTLHWEFQNRLGVATRGDHSIIYNSGRDFGRSEADAWWLCFDTCRMISNELQGAGAVLKEADTKPFFATRVEGVQRPKLFAKFVHCDGWEPVDAEVRVTDPINLAQTLGGRNLYGAGYHAPVRELLQNAIDATLLRASIGREGFIPKVRLTLSKTESAKIQIIVEDNGIGMSERVLTRRLLDFGQSGWRSDEVAQENPEISLSSVKLSGKFGIGFFSVFLLGDDITVVTRRYKDGMKDGLALEFVGLARRPILRKASEEEQSDIFTTRIVAIVSDPNAVAGLLQNPAIKRPRRTIRFRLYPQHDDFFQYLRWLVVSSTVEIELVDRISDRSFTHQANWVARSSEEFIKDLVEYERDSSQPELSSLYSDALTNLQDEDGRVVGRAAITLGRRDPGMADASFATVGGLTYPAHVVIGNAPSNTSVVPPYVGVMEGVAVIATRGYAQLAIAPSALARWATEQGKIGVGSSLSVVEKMELARAVYWAGGDPKELPIAYFEGEFISLSDFRNVIFSRDNLFLPITISSPRTHDSYWLYIDDLRVRFFFDRVTGGVCVLSPRERESALERAEDGFEINSGFDIVVDGDIRSKLKPGSYDILFDLLEKGGRQYSLRYESRTIFDSGLTVGRSTLGFALLIDKT
jgi:hypothetical protein